MDQGKKPHHGVGTAIARGLVIALLGAAAVAGPAQAEAGRRDGVSAATSRATGSARSEASSSATGGSASVIFDTERRFLPENCDQTLAHCRALAKADALWLMGRQIDALRLVARIGTD